MGICSTPRFWHPAMATSNTEFSIIRSYLGEVLGGAGQAP